MKNLIRKWLEVPDLRDEYELTDSIYKSVKAYAIEAEYMKKDAVIEVVKEALYEAFSPDIRSGYGYRIYLEGDSKNIRGEWINLTEQMIGKQAANEAEKHLREITKPESFIDEVVERIKKKQLNG